VRDDYHCISRTERGVSVLQHEETGLCPIVERTASSSRDPKPDPPSRIYFGHFPSVYRRSRSLVFAQETGRNITGAAYRFKEVRALFRSALEYMSAVGELAFLQELASPAPLSRGPQAPPPRPSGGGGGGGPSWLQDKRSFSLKRPREEGAGVEARAPNKKGKSPPKKGKSPPKKGKSPPEKGKPEGQKKGQNRKGQRYTNKNPATWTPHKAKIMADKARIAAGGKSNKGVKKSPRIASKKKSRGGWATE